MLEQTARKILASNKIIHYNSRYMWNRLGYSAPRGAATEDLAAPYLYCIM